MKFHIKDKNLKTSGKKRIIWAQSQMPVLLKIKEIFSKNRPFAGKKISGCLHVTTETANLVIALKAGGAEVLLCASNPLSTQDDVAASLVFDFGISVYGVKGEDNNSYYRNIEAAINHSPDLLMDDGCDLVSGILSKNNSFSKNILGSTEETTTGVVRLKAMEKNNILRFPVFAVNDAKTKNLFDNRYGTGQSTIDGIIRATDILLAGKNIVVAGYGWCGRGFALRAKGMGGNVIVTEIDPIKALEAAMDGFRVMPMDKAAEIGDIFCTLTGNLNVIRGEHFRKMKNGAVIANSGHFDCEIDIKTLKKISKKVIKNVRPLVDEYVLSKDKSVFLLAEGRLVNLACAEGHPASVMDMSFSTQALVAEYIIKKQGTLQNKVYNVPKYIEDFISKEKLSSMGMKIDKLTTEQARYLSSWSEGT